MPFTNSLSPKYWFFPALLLFAACSPDEVTKITYEVPAAVDSFIEEFEQEALARGRDINIENLVVKFGKNLESTSGVDAAGLCRTAVGATPEITLDSTSNNWTNNAESREALVFHELGHCILGYLGATAHRNDLLPNGNVKSIMHEGGGTIYGNTFNYFKREYYMDELFDPNVPAPDWATNLPAYDDISESQKVDILREDFDNNDNFWPINNGSIVVQRIQGGKYTFQSVNGNFHRAVIKKQFNPSNDFEIEASLRMPEGNSANTIEWGSSSANNAFLYGFTSGNSVFLGKRSYGISFSKSLDDFDPGTFTKFTIRKIGPSYYFYIDEELVDNGMYESPAGSLLGFGVGPYNTLEIDYLYIRRIEL